MKISKNAMGNIVAEAAELMNIFLVDSQEFRATINAIIDYCSTGKEPTPNTRMKTAFWEFLKAKIDKIADRAERARLLREQKAAKKTQKPDKSEKSEKSEKSYKSDRCAKPSKETKSSMESLLAEYSAEQQYQPLPVTDPAKTPLRIFTNPQLLNSTITV